jgi:GMP reductase
MQKFDFKDILIEPAIFTDINSRSEVNPYLNDNLPLMTAPMDTVIDAHNEQIFINNKIVAVLPRGEVPGKEESFISVSLKEMKEFLDGSSVQLENFNNILIDMANGHMKQLFETAKVFLKKFPDKKLMVGNVANTTTYRMFASIGVHFVRIGIGNGAGCLTTQQLGVGYPMASLIEECYEANIHYGFNTKIVADGGMKDYSDIIKALALGADYVMLGSIFNKALESCAETYIYNDEESTHSDLTQYEAPMVIIDQYASKDMFNAKVPMYKKFRGMSTKEVQRKWGKDKIKTSEGISKIQKVEYTLDGWVENFESYLRSAMSYTNSYNLEEFKDSTINFITQKSYERFAK